jgi:hypothetical protein
MRYALESCCKDVSHIINRSDPNFGANLGTVLSNIKDWPQDLAFTRRIRNFAVLCPTEVMQRAEVQRSGCFWIQGPVHMNTEGYRFLGVALLEQFADVKLSRKVEPKTTNVNKQRLPDRAATRMSWVGGNDSAVHKVYDQPQHGSDNRGGGAHGSNRGRGRGGGYQSWRGRGRVSSKQSNFFFGSNRNKPKHNLFWFIFGLFRETKKLFFWFVSVFRIQFETTETNRSVSKQTEKIYRYIFASKFNTKLKIRITFLPGGGATKK